MKSMKWIILILIIILGSGLGFWFLRHSPTASSAQTDSKETPSVEENQQPVAQVRITPLKESRIEESATLYGSIDPVPQQVKTYSVPFESRVKQIKVTLGQTVHKGDVLLEIEPSLAELLELNQARSEVKSTQDVLKKLNEKLELKLATRQEVIEAQQSVKDKVQQIRDIFLTNHTPRVLE